MLDAENTSRTVWADSAYRSKAHETMLAARGYRSQVHRKGRRNKPLTKREQPATRPSLAYERASSTSSAFSRPPWSGKRVRPVGLERAVKIGLMGLVYNWRRLVFLQTARSR